MLKFLCGNFMGRRSRSHHISVLVVVSSVLGSVINFYFYFLFFYFVYVRATNQITGICTETARSLFMLKKRFQFRVAIWR